MFQSFNAWVRCAHVPEPVERLRRRTGTTAMAPLVWIALTIMRAALHTPHSAHVVERTLMALGLVASGSGLLSLLSCGMGWSDLADFLWIWLGVGAGACPMSPLIDRSLRPLFWTR